MRIFPFLVNLLYARITAPLDIEKCHVTENMIPSPPDKIQAGLRCTRSNELIKKNHKKYIVGGSRTEKGEYPWQVRLSIYGKTNTYCGGSILSDDWVITAAHCCEDASNDNSIKVHVGDWNRNEVSNDEFSVWSSKIIMHPGKKFKRVSLYSFIILFSLSWSKWNSQRSLYDPGSEFTNKFASYLSRMLCCNLLTFSRNLYGRSVSCVWLGS